MKSYTDLEQSKKLAEILPPERPINDVFTCDGVRMKVQEADSFCRGCFFHGKVVRKQKHCEVDSVRAQIGKCKARTDGKFVVFKKDFSKFQ